MTGSAVFAVGDAVGARVAASVGAVVRVGAMVAVGEIICAAGVRVAVAFGTVARGVEVAVGCAAQLISTITSKIQNRFMSLL